ncbi:plasmid stabilization system (plasmid) [Thalassoporum mexicanum PCC 7367]|nr:plasmid stabilization system [Pseudanabaena sp. PCC 7367]
MSAPAQDDLVNIYTYIAQDNPVAAQQFISDLSRKMYELAELGISGVSREWIRPGLRAFPYCQRCIYFRSYPDRLVVVRVLHGSQDIEQQEFLDN